SADVVGIINSLVNDPGFARHGVAVDIYILQRFGVVPRPGLLAAAQDLASIDRKCPESAKSPESVCNPFFYYVAYCADDTFLDKVLKLRTSKADDRPHALYQWAWEREDVPKEVQKTMYWDCLFAAQLYAVGTIKNDLTANFPPGLKEAFQIALQAVELATKT